MPKFIFILVVASSALFRLTNLDIIEFKADEASNLLLASLPLFGSSFPPAGIVSSVGILNTPLFNYILFPIVSVSLEPQTVALFIALINSLAIGFFYLIIRKYYNNTLAIITTLLIAFSPWSILFSRKIWPPDLIFPLFVILFLSIHKILIDKKPIFLMPAGAISLFLIQLEMASAFLIVLGGILLLLQKPKINLKYMIIGVFIGMLPAVPYAIHLLQDNCQQCNVVAEAMSTKLSTRHSEVFIKPFQILNQGGFNSVLGSYVSVFAEKFSLIYKMKFFFYSEYLLLPIGVFLFWKRYPKLRLFIYSVIGLLIVYFLFGIEPHMHYFIIISPLLFLFVGTALYSLISSKNSLLRRLSMLYFLSLIIYSISYNFSFFQFIKVHGYNMDGDYGLPLNFRQQEIKEEYSKYKNNSDYQQLIISSYIPLYIMHGTSPFAQMVYPHNKTEKILPELEEKLKDNPQDPRVLHQLVSYYSKTLPQQSTIDTLREKVRIVPEYKPVYRAIYESYLQEHLKKSLVSQKFQIIFEYPQHWDAGEIDDKIYIKDSSFQILMEANPENFPGLLSKNEFISATYVTTKAKILNKSLDRTECVTKEKEWCGITYSPILFKNKIFLITYGYAEGTNTNFGYNDPSLLFAVKTMDEILASWREL